MHTNTWMHEEKHGRELLRLNSWQTFFFFLNIASHQVGRIPENNWALIPESVSALTAKSIIYGFSKLLVAFKDKWSCPKFKYLTKIYKIHKLI